MSSHSMPESLFREKITIHCRSCCVCFISSLEYCFLFSCYLFAFFWTIPIPFGPCDELTVLHPLLNPTLWPSHTQRRPRRPRFLLSMEACHSLCLGSQGDKRCEPLSPSFASFLSFVKIIWDCRAIVYFQKGYSLESGKSVPSSWADGFTHKQARLVCKKSEGICLA